MSRRAFAVHLAIGVAVIVGIGCEKPPKTEKIATNPGYAIPAYSEPIWSPDGSRLAFNHVPLDSIYVASGMYQYAFNQDSAGFWMVDSNGTNQERVLSRYLDVPSWSLDGGWIAYGYYADIWKIRTTSSGVDSTATQQLTFQGLYHGPVWNPSGTTLLFWRPPGGPVSGVYRLNAGGGAPEHIGGNYWVDPYWSPNGSRVLFIEPDGNYQAIARADTMGSNPQVIRSGLLGPRHPQWSPDGSMIAFTDNEPGSNLVKLYLMNPDGSNLRTATPDPVLNEFAWSPDSKRIAYVRLDFANHSYQNGNVWIVEVQTGTLRQFTFSGPGH